MKLVIGLGNPGAKHAQNRHNIGFLAVERIAAEHRFGPWRSKFKAEIAEGSVGGEKAIIVKPQTYMNLSGQAVGEAMRFYKLQPADVIVLYDELDLAPGKMRVKRGGGLAGHNGLRSINAHIGPDFMRVRLGIGHPGDKALVSRHVLSDFAKADADWREPLLDAVAVEFGTLAKGDEAGFMNAVALRLKPPREKSGKPPEPAKPHDSPQDAVTADTRSALQKLIDRFS